MPVKNVISVVNGDISNREIMLIYTQQLTTVKIEKELSSHATDMKCIGKKRLVFKNPIILKKL